MLKTFHALVNKRERTKLMGALTDALVTMQNLMSAVWLMMQRQMFKLSLNIQIHPEHI